MALRNKTRRRRKRNCRQRTRNHLGGRNKRRGKKSRGKKRRKSRKSKRRRSRRRRRMKGGSGCGLNKNLGEQYTLRRYNNLSGGNPRDNYVSTNNNYDVPLPYKQQRGGGSWAQDFGLSDLYRSVYSLGNTVGGIHQNYTGRPGYESSNPMDQPGLKTPDYLHKIPDVKAHHNQGVINAANKGTVK